MKKNVFQLFTENAIPILAGLGTLVSIIAGISNIGKLMGYRLGSILLCIVCLTWLLLIHMMEKGKIKWIIKGGHTARIKKPGFRINLGYFSIVLILIGYISYDFYKNGPYSSNSQNQVSKIVFDPKDPYFKVLILPWQKECMLNGKTYDIGLVLKNRLEDMVRKDSVSLHVYYLSDSSDYNNFNKDSFNTLMKFHNANMIIHGYYSFSECEGSNSDKICYMYQTNFMRMGVETTNNAYEMHDMHGLEDIREGAGQESIDFIIHWVAAMSEFQNRNFARSIELFKKIKAYELNQDILFQLSNCYYYMNDREDFKSMLEKVLQINPHHEEASIHMSIVLMEEGKFDLARERLEKVQALHSKNISVLRDLCLVWRSLKDTVRSDMYYRQFISVVPECDTNFKILGAFYKDLKKYPKSKEYYEKALNVCSKHVGDWCDLGCAYLLLGDSVKAKPYFEIALEKDKRSVTTLYSLGVLFHREKDYIRAGEYLHRAEAIAPRSDAILIALGNNCQSSDQKENAVGYFEKVLTDKPNMVPVLYNAAVLYLQLKKYDKANAYLDRLTGYDPDNIRILNSIAYLCADKDNYSQAEVYYKRLLKLSPGNGAVLYNLASMSAYQHKQVAALKFLSRAITSMPNLKKTAKKDKAFDCIRAEKEFNNITD